MQKKQICPKTLRKIPENEQQQSAKLEMVQKHEMFIWRVTRTKVEMGKKRNIASGAERFRRKSITATCTIEQRKMIH